MRSGFSLFELLVVIAVLAASAALAVDAASGLRDRLAVQAARERLAALHVEARRWARRGWPAAVEVVAGSGRARVLRAGVEVRATLLAAEGVVVRLSGARRSALVRYDPLGIGRPPGYTVVFERHGARATLVVSSYGRLRRP